MEFTMILMVFGAIIGGMRYSSIKKAERRRLERIRTFNEKYNFIVE